MNCSLPHPLLPRLVKSAQIAHLLSHLFLRGATYLCIIATKYEATWRSTLPPILDGMWDEVHHLLPPPPPPSYRIIRKLSHLLSQVTLSPTHSQCMKPLVELLPPPPPLPGLDASPSFVNTPPLLKFPGEARESTHIQDTFIHHIIIFN